MTSNRYKDFLLVSKDVLPEAIIKTAQVKELLAKEDTLTIYEAAEKIGISRSAFYKYRDGVFPFYEASRQKIVTVSLILEHRAGILSHVLNKIASFKASVLTINQGIPLQGVANVSISIEIEKMTDLTEHLLNGLSQIEGVRKVDLIGQNYMG